MERCNFQILEGILGGRVLGTPAPPRRGAWLPEPGKVKRARARLEVRAPRGRRASPGVREREAV